MGDRHPHGGEDPLAYGDYQSRGPPTSQGDDGYGGTEEGERGLIGDTYRRLRGKHSQTGESSESKPSGLGSFIFDKLAGAVQDIGSELNSRISGGNQSHSHTHTGVQCADGVHSNTQHRYNSFAVQRTGNDVKWYVDGCGYFWAVSRALEQATQSIWILDCKAIKDSCTRDLPHETNH